MRNFENLKIDKAIVHILDKKNGEEICSDFLLELDDESDRLIRTHIKKHINDQNTNIAKFKTDEGVVAVKEACQGIIESDDNEYFVEQSQIIAKKLYSVMTKVTTAANFVVCKYIADEINYVALLKMDFNKITKAEQIKVDDKIKVILSRNGVALPNKNQKLHKCVFFKCFNDVNEYDIIILDRQVDKEEKEVSDFFANNFLQCELCGTDKINTKKFKKVSEDFLRRIYKGTAEYHKKRDVLLGEMLDSEEIFIDDFTKNIFRDNEDVAKAYRKLISEELGHLNIKIDEDFKSKSLTKRSYYTHEGITINILNKMIDKLSIEDADDGKSNIIIKGVMLRDIKDN